MSRKSSRICMNNNEYVIFVSETLFYETANFNFYFIFVLSDALLMFYG